MPGASLSSLLLRRLVAWERLQCSPHGVAVNVETSGGEVFPSLSQALAVACSLEAGGAQAPLPGT